MTLEALDNLVKIRRLNKEPPDQNQFDGMVKSARTRLLDIEATGLSEEGRFALAYGAAHSLALAADIGFITRSVPVLPVAGLSSL